MAEYAHWEIKIDGPDSAQQELLVRELGLLVIDLEEFAAHWLRRRDHPAIFRVVLPSEK